jgi:hypothetical protein
MDDACRRNAGDEVEGHLRQRDAVALGVGIRPGFDREEILPGFETGEGHVVMAARAEVGRKGLWHEGRDGTDRGGHFLGHEPQEGEPVGGGEGVGVVEVELVLPVPAFLIEGKDAPAELVHVFHHGIEEVHRAEGLVHVVGGTGAEVTVLGQGHELA